MRKVKIGELINSLVYEVEAIDASDRPHGEKTQKITTVSRK
ncbi:hypothetical protein ACLBSJ_32535, partial [Klebsiella pneumoniae]